MELYTYIAIAMVIFLFLIFLLIFVRGKRAGSKVVEEQEEEIICPNPNCGYKGIPKKKEQGDTATGILLLILGFWPGVLYFIFYRKTYFVCPKCGTSIR